MKLSEKKLGRMRRDILAILPMLTGVLDDITQISRDRAGQKNKPGDAASSGADIITEYARLLFERRYDDIVGILAVIYEVEPAAMEEKTMEEFVEMAVETLDDRTLWRFFPRLAAWVPKMRSGT